MTKVPYLNWENIFLDTSIIFAYIQATRENNTDPACTFVKRIIDDLNTTKTTGKKNRNFYVSAVSISEMYDKSADNKKTEKIISKMNIGTMTYVSFDTDIAEHLTHNYHSVLGTNKQNAFVRTLGFPENDLVMAREWITKDLMITATADYLKCDVVLTLDEKTFLPICNKVDIFCCVCKKENFNYNDSYIFEYQKSS